MRKSARIALCLGLLGAFACAQAAAPGDENDLNERAADKSDTGDGDEEEEQEEEEETGDGDAEEVSDPYYGGTTTGDGDYFSGDGDEAQDEESADPGAPAASDPLGGLGSIFDQLLGGLGLGGSGGADAGTP